ncbi:MAG: aquaporin [Bacilli bacterium]|nr:aquaporin [Bacilli bacterium]
MKKYIAEFIGTFILVFFGTGIAVVTGDLLCTALAFGLAIVASAYVIGNISGCHVNPAVSLACLINGKLSVKDFIGYVVGQIFGAFMASTLLYVVFKNTLMVNAPIVLGANGFAELSDSNITLLGAFIVEVVLTFVFVYTILGVTSDESKKSVAGIVIGLTLMFVHLLGIKLTGTSVNPARSLAPAVLMGGKALEQVWLFIVAPCVGASGSALLFKYFNTEKEKVDVPKKVKKRK